MPSQRFRAKGRFGPRQFLRNPALLRFALECLDVLVFCFGLFVTGDRISKYPFSVSCRDVSFRNTSTC